MSAPGDTMLAAVYHGRRDLRVEPVPRLTAARPGELLLAVRTVGVCGTDAAEWAAGPTQFPAERAHPVTGHHGPLVIGHEFSGTVVGVGDGVDQRWLGELVASCGAVPCGRCRPCAAGRTNRCRHYSGVGLHRDGALTAYVSTPAASCLPVAGAGLSGDEAALGQPMAIAVHAARRGGAAGGDHAVVLGAGGIGAFLVYALAAWGVTVTAVDLDDHRLRIAAELGAQHTVTAGTAAAGDDVAAVRATLPEPPSVVYEATGAPAALRTALALAGVGGRVVLVGMQKRPVELALQPVTVGEQELIGTNAMIRETDFPEAIDLLARRRGRWDLIAPRVLPLADVVPGALEPMAAGTAPAIKTLIDPGASRARPLDTAG